MSDECHDWINSLVSLSTSIEKLTLHLFDDSQFHLYIAKTHLQSLSASKSGCGFQLDFITLLITFVDLLKALKNPQSNKQMVMMTLDELILDFQSLQSSEYLIDERSLQVLEFYAFRCETLKFLLNDNHDYQYDQLI